MRQRSWRRRQSSICCCAAMRLGCSPGGKWTICWRRSDSGDDGHKRKGAVRRPCCFRPGSTGGAGFSITSVHRVRVVRHRVRCRSHGSRCLLAAATLLAACLLGSTLLWTSLLGCVLLLRSGGLLLANGSLLLRPWLASGFLRCLLCRLLLAGGAHRQ